MLLLVLHAMYALNFDVLVADYIWENPTNQNAHARGVTLKNYAFLARWVELAAGRSFLRDCAQSIRGGLFTLMSVISRSLGNDFRQPVFVFLNPNISGSEIRVRS